MTRLSICPHYLTDYDLTTPEEIHKQIIKPLDTILSAATSTGITIVVSRQILAKHRDNYPWNRSEDNVWRGHLMDWNATITSRLAKAEIVDAPTSSSQSISTCRKLHAETLVLFNSFLALYGTKTLSHGRHEEAIFTSSACTYSVNPNPFYLLEDTSCLKFVVHPWLRLYQKPLPPDGDFRFVPPSNWKTMTRPMRAGAPCYGFVDDNGNIWTWDKLHKDHWDVQLLRENKHINAMPDGSIRR